MGVSIRAQGRLIQNSALCCFFLSDCKQAKSIFADSKDCCRLQCDLDGGQGAYRKPEPSTDKHTYSLTSSPIGLRCLEATRMEITGKKHWPWQQADSHSHHPAASLGHQDCSIHRHPAQLSQGASGRPMGHRSDALSGTATKKAPDLPYIDCTFVLPGMPDLSKHYEAHQVVRGRLS